MLADAERSVGPAPFRQAQGPEHVEGLVAGPVFYLRMVRWRAATLHQLHESGSARMHHAVRRNSAAVYSMLAFAAPCVLGIRADAFSSFQP
jgi:hypothetical protein